MKTVKLTIFFDGECPLCKREVDFLQSKNQNGHLKFIDINCSDFNSYFNHLITYKQAMERIHALKSDGSLIKDIEVFQEAYKWIGLGWIYAPTKLPVIDKLIEFIYRLWAKYRLRITFRPPLEKLCSEKDCNL
tara:strand:- start:2633 stop:3031 length:399 start_codon:yes stop_codon:yes gene_type:complete